MRKTQNISDIYVVGHQPKQHAHTRKREDKAMQERFARLPWPHWLPHTPREIDAANDARHDGEHPVDAIIMLVASAIAGVEIGNWLAPDIAAWIAGLPPVTFSCFGC